MPSLERPVVQRHHVAPTSRGLIATAGVATPMNTIGEGATPLMYACQQARHLEVRSILFKKPNTVRDRDRTSKTALHYCAENAAPVCAEMLLKAAPDLIDARDEDGYTALHLAVIAGNRPLIKTLLVKNSDVNSLDNERHSVVHWATVCGEVEALQMVLDAGAVASTPDIHGGYPLHYAAQMCGPNSEMGNDVRFGLAVLRKLLARGVEVNVTDRDGRQPILWAASADSRAGVSSSSGSADAILALVNAGANVEADDKDGLTGKLPPPLGRRSEIGPASFTGSSSNHALHCAASRGHTDCLETLVTLCGAEVDVIDTNGCTALFYAVTLGHADSTQLLLSFGAEPNRQDRKGRTPAHCGAAKGQLETLRILGAHSANLWTRNVRGDYPLHEAVASGRKDLVRWLLGQRADAINAPNNDGRCALHIAAINNNVEMCKIVLDSGSLLNPVMRTSKGQMMTPLDAALHRGNRGCAKYLQLHGGVPATKLTEQAAKLRGGTNRSVTAEPLSEHYTTPDPGASAYLTPAAATPLMSVSPVDAALLLGDDARTKRGDARYLQVRLNEDVAIRHVERIDDPIACRYHRFLDDSSEDEMRRRRRRRRWRDKHGSREREEDEDDRRRRRRKRRDESDSMSEERDRSVRRGRRKDGEKGSDADSDRDTRKKWAGSRQESEESEGEGDKKVRKGKSSKTSKKVKIKSSNRSDSEVDERRRHSKGRRKYEDSEKTDTESSENDSNEASEKKSKEENKSDRSRDKSKENGTKKQGTVKKAKDKLGRDSSRDQDQKVDENKVKKTELKSKQSSIPRRTSKVDAPKSNGEKEKMAKTEEKPRARKLTVPSKDDPKVKETPKNSTTPKKPIRRVSVKRNSVIDRAKSFEIVEEIIVKTAEDHLETLQETVTHHTSSVVDEAIQKTEATFEETSQQLHSAVDENVAQVISAGVEHSESALSLLHDVASQQVVTADVHHEQGSVTSHDVEETDATQSNQETVEESESQSRRSADLTGSLSGDRLSKETSPEKEDEKEKEEKEDEEKENDDKEDDGKEDEEKEDSSEKAESSERVGEEESDETTRERHEDASDRTSYDGVSEQSVDVQRPQSAKEDLKSMENERDEDEGEKEEETMENERDEDEKEKEEETVKEDDVLHQETNEEEKENVQKEEEQPLNDEPLLEHEDHMEHKEDELQDNSEIKTDKQDDAAEEEALIESYDMSNGGNGGRMSRSRRKRSSRLTESQESRSTNEKDELEAFLSNERTDTERNVVRSASASVEKDGVDGEGDSRSRSEASTSRSRNGDSSLHLDSGIEPSPRRDKSSEGKATSDIGAGKGRRSRVQRPCRTDDDERPEISTMSVTQAVQNSIRKYHLERSIFQELLELKRLQIRSGRANEQLLVKRLVDDYRRAGLIVGKRHYDGVYTYRNFEKYLYDQLRLLQSTDRRLIPRIRSSDDLEQLTKALKNARMTPLADMAPDNPVYCTHGTHRCHHAAHAYTGVPCAAYITRINHHQMPKSVPSHTKGFLPRIDTAKSGIPRPSKPIDPTRPVTLELSHGAEKQVISLPTDTLDKSKRYYVTFTIKGGSNGESKHNEEGPVTKREKEIHKHRHPKSL